MRIELQQVSKGRGLALPETSLAYGEGEALLAVAETEQRPTVLGLIAAGRMRPGTGRVLIDGEEHPAEIRRRVTLVDAPEVSDPVPDVSVFGVVAEELMFAGRPAGRRAVRTWLAEAGMASIGGIPIADVAPALRLRLLLELAVLRPDVRGIVLVAPDRHGGDPVTWWELAEEFAARGPAVLVIAGAASAAVLDGRARRAETVEVAR